MPYQRGPFVRPLLDVRRREVLRYLAKRRIPFIEDPRTPIAASPGPASATSGSRSSSARTRAWSRRSWRSPPTPAEDRRRRACRGERRPPWPAWPRPGGDPARGGAGGEIEISYGRVHWPAPPQAPPATAVTEVSGPGRYGAGPAMLEVEEGTAPAAPAADAVAFDLDRLMLPLRVRAPRAGDRMRPRGGRGSRKLSDLFIDAKIPRTRRAGLPLLEAADGTILFVPGLRPSEVGRPGRRRGAGSRCVACRACAVVNSISASDGVFHSERGNFG
jgi:tRNA(Ile)-lysidine synthetase-like protein